VVGLHAVSSALIFFRASLLGAGLNPENISADLVRKWVRLV